LVYIASIILESVVGVALDLGEDWDEDSGADRDVDWDLVQVHSAAK
jgi:hypothetical protein